MKTAQIITIALAGGIGLYAFKYYKKSKQNLPHTQHHTMTQQHHDYKHKVGRHLPRTKNLVGLHHSYF